MSEYTLLDIDLRLFDGEGGDGAAAPGDGSAQGETMARPASTRRGKTGEYSNVLFGRQGDAPAAEGAGGTQEAPGAGEQTEGVSVTSNTLEEKRKAYRDLVTGEYKDLYTQDIQKKIDRRFKDSKAVEAERDAMKPVIDMLMARYSISDGDVGKLTRALDSDAKYWETAAEEAGMSVEQYRRFQQLERQNAALLEEQRRREGQAKADQTLQRWYAEGDAMKGRYPGFDLAAEAQDPQFLAMLRSGVPVETAYKVVHMDDIIAATEAMTAKATEKQVVDNIRAKGARPQENGTSAQSGFTVKDDVTKLSKKDRAEIVRRAARGESIVF